MPPRLLLSPEAQGDLVEAFAWYEGRRRAGSARAAQDRELERRIHRLFRQHHGTYGSPRIQRALRAAGWQVSRRRVERLMRAAGLRARVAQIYRANPRLHRFYGQHPNRLWARVARRPDRIWVGDITYVPVVGRWWFLAVVLDQCSRRVLAWTLGRTRDARLTRSVLDAAVRRRHPRAGLVFHSDRGSEYAAAAFRDRLRALGIRQSATRVGTPGDNAHMESFFHSLKAEIVHGARFATARQLRLALRRYFRYYNHRRLHSALGYCSPADYESRAA
jgi:transposase InsO family protein